MKGQIITVALILLGHTFLTPAVQAIGFDYYNDHGVMSYGKGYWGDKKIIAQFPEMSRADLRLVKNISGKTGYIPSDEISIKNEEYHWVTDGRVILWRGKIVSNPPGTPTVDIASFQAMGRFAVDKYSLYFDGQRTESNSGASRVDLATLKAIEGNSTTLVDSKNLYLSGRRQGSSSNVTVLEKRWWGINPRLMSVNRNLYSNDLLIRSGQNIYLWSVGICAYTIIMTLLIVNGPNTKTLTSCIGCFGGVVLAGILTFIMTKVLALTGVVDESSYSLTTVNPDHPIDLLAIIFAAIIK